MEYAQYIGGMLNSRDVPAAGNFPVQASTEQPVAEDGDRDHDTIPNFEISAKSVGQKFIQPNGGKIFFRILGPTNSDFKSRNPFSCWKVRFKTEVCICSSYPTEVMTRIKEVEMVHSVDDLKSSCSFQGCAPFPDFELLHARIASALNKIIQNSFSKKMLVWRNKRH